MSFNNFDFDYECSTNNFFKKYLNKIVLKDRAIMSRSFGRGLQLLNSIEFSLFSPRDFANLKEVLNTYKHPNEIYLDAQNKFGDSALHICAQNEALHFLKCIIEKGANVNIKNSQGNTPLFEAIRYYGDKEFIQALIDAGANINEQNNDGDTPMIFATRMQRKEAIELLYKAGANPFIKNKRNQDVEQAVSNITDPQFNNMIQKIKQACNLGNEVLKSIDKNAPVTTIENLLLNNEHPFGINLNVQNQDGATALIRAARFNHTKLAQQLIQYGADMNITDKEGNTALHEAAALGHEELVQTLIDAKANINVQNSKGETPLHRAINQKSTPVVKALLTVGADKEIKTNSGATALDLAKESNYYDAIQLLSNTKDYSPYLLGWRLFNTLKHLKDGKEKEEKINQLIHLTHPSVINFDVQSPQDGNTPLHFAIKNNYLAVAKALINAKAQVNTQNNKGETPLHIAALNLKCDIIQDLLLAGADKEIKNLESKTAFELMTKKVEALFNTNKEPVVIKKANSNSFKEQNTNQNEG